MEVAEEASLEAAIGWLAQTILTTLLIGKLDAWIRQAGLADHVERLKSEVERVEMVVAAVSGRGIKNKPLARSLARLKELLYDADDAVDELDYYRLQQQVEGVTYDDSESMHGAEHLELDERSRGGAAEMPSSNGDNLRSKCWKEFTVTKRENGKAVEAKCIHCDAPPIKCGSKNGTSVLSNHLKSKGCTRKRGATDQPPNPSSTGDDTANATLIVIGNSSSRKRRRADEESAQITAANTHTPWDKAELSNRIQEITCQLQDIQGVVSEVLKLHGSDSATSSNHYRGTTSDQYPRTSSLVQRKVYGRVADKNSILKLMAEDRSDSVTVLPIVGIGGIGKTALAQLVYNDPDVESKFDHRIWVWVSHNFDEVRLTREMLDFVSRKRHEGSPQTIERYEGISSFAKLQEILKGHMEFLSKRFLLIFDDVWDNMDDYRWNKLLAPLKSSRAKGNVILVTTRSFSVARRTGTVESIKLRALANEDFWLLCKAYAFGDENYEGHQSLSIVGRQIAEKLKGNPLAAETAGALLRENLTIDHWSNILMNEDWKSLQLSRGIMPALKLSYDQLPYYLQQCFSFSSLFPYNYQFLGCDLVHMWISQGFVKRNNSSKRLEEIGQYYLTDLVNLGFFQQVEEEESSPGGQIRYAMCGLMHDFGRMVSRTECATVDGLQCDKMLPTIHHLSIVTYCAYSKDQHGNIPRNKKFEETLRNAVTSVGKFRTLVLLGHYDSFFFQLFQETFRKAQSLRLVQMSATSADFNSFQCSLANSANPVHVRYLKHESDGLYGALPQVLIMFFHLQVLDVGSNTYLTVPNGMNNLVSLRHLVAEKGVYSSISSIGKMTSLQELHDFKVQTSSGFEITQLQSMNELVRLGISHLDDVQTREEAYGAGLRNKQHLEMLHLFWKDTSSSMGIEEFFRLDDSGPSSEPSATATEVLEGLEPHRDLKHLKISGYNGPTGPTWLAKNVSVTTLQTLHLENFVRWQIFPSLVRLPFLTKLTLRNMQKLKEVLIPSLEELVLVEMPKLERCSCTSVGDLNSSLRVLEIKSCPTLKVFDLFEDGQKFEVEQKSWLPGVRKLILRDCPHLEVLNPLPTSTAFSKLLIYQVSTVPCMERSSGEALYIGSFGEQHFHKSCDELRILDDKILAFHNLRSLKSVVINGCQNLTSISFEGFSQLVSLKRLEINKCRKLFSSLVLPERTREDMPAANCKAFPSLESLAIKSCGIAGKWLPLMLRHAPGLEELILYDCQHITTLLPMEEEENTAREDSSSGNPDDALTGLAPDGLLHIPLNPISSLKRIDVQTCPLLTFDGSKEGLSGFTALVKLQIYECPRMPWSFMPRDGNDDQANGRWLLPQSLVELFINGYSQGTLQPCFLRNLTCLKKLGVVWANSLESLRLHFCTALEELTIGNCKSLAALDGLQSLRSLTRLEVYGCPGLRPWWESFSRAGYALCPRLEMLVIDDLSVLTASLCKHLTSLKILELRDLVLTDKQERALVLLKSFPSLKRLRICWCSGISRLPETCLPPSLEELEIEYCTDLPAGLDTLPAVKRLKIFGCSGISRLPETCLPPSLEELEIEDCTDLVDLPAGLHTLPSLKKLNIEYCTEEISRLSGTCLPPSLEELEIVSCTDLPAGLDVLPAVKRLRIFGCLGISRLPETCLPLSLEELEIENYTDLVDLPAGLHTLPSLKKLKIEYFREISRLSATCLPPSLEELEITGGNDLVDLPLIDFLAGPHTLPSLKRLKIFGCSGISRLPETCLPPSLEELEIYGCSEELADQCKLLPTSKLNVKTTQIDRFGNRHVICA